MAWPSMGTTTVFQILGAAVLAASVAAPPAHAQEAQRSSAFATAEAHERDAETLRLCQACWPTWAGSSSTDLSLG